MYAGRGLLPSLNERLAFILPISSFRPEASSWTYLSVHLPPFLLAATCLTAELEGAAKLSSISSIAVVIVKYGKEQTRKIEDLVNIHKVT